MIHNHIAILNSQRVYPHLQISGAMGRFSGGNGVLDCAARADRCSQGLETAGRLGSQQVPWHSANNLPQPNLARGNPVSLEMSGDSQVKGV